MTDLSNFDFREALARTDACVVADLSAASGVCQVAFGGIAAGLGIAPFEFFKLTTSFPTKKIFVRDLSQSWYHGRLPGIGSGIVDLVYYLRSMFEQINPERVVFFGNSMGGYAALLFGALLKVDQVIAFAPQTFISKELRLRHSDDRWASQMDTMYATDSCASEYFDLLPMLRTAGHPVPTEIHVGTRDPLDILHAMRLDGVPSISVHQYEIGAHGDLVKRLRNNGTLSAILAKALRI